MKKLALFLICSSMFATGAFAQQKVVDEVKKSIGGLSASVDTYKNAMNNIKGALTDPSTKGSAEAWFVAGKAGFGLYDKYIGERAIGKKIDEVGMANALLQGYEYFQTALPLDSVLDVEKDGTPKVDKKTGAKKYKTKYSKEIVNLISGHFNDYFQAGNSLYDAKDFKGASKLWDIFCSLPDAEYLGKLKPTVGNDSTIGNVRFYQAVASMQAEDWASASVAFEKAIKAGNKKKDVYDYAIMNAANMKDEAKIIEIAKAAFPLFGKEDPQYVKVLINDLINQNKYAEATKYVDEALVADASNADYHNLKGILLENQGQPEAALACFTKAVELNPESAQCQFDLGRYYYNKALQTIEANPSLNNKELADKVNPIYQKALPHLEKSFQLNPDNSDVKNALRNIYYRLGDETKLNEIEKAY